jgi:hypothetical protein
MALTQEQLNRILGNQSVVDKVFSENRPTVSAQRGLAGEYGNYINNPNIPFNALRQGDVKGAAKLAANNLITGLQSAQTPEGAMNFITHTPSIVGMTKNVSPRMTAAEAEALGYWHPIGNEKKLKIPVNEMTSVVTEPSIITTPKIITPEDLYGGVGISTKGDRSNVGLLHEINGIKLDEPVPLEGGFRYMDVQDPYNSVWASAKGHVTQYSNKAKPIIAQGKDAFLISTLAGHGATDFNAMMTDSLFKQMKNLEISNKAKQEFDNVMKERRPDWLGINNPKSIDQLNNNGELRHTFHDVVELDKFQKAGFPDIASTRKAVTDPNLLDIPNAYSGYRIGKIDPNNIILQNPINPHTTYDTAMGGNLVGTAGVQLPVKNWFPDFFANRRLENKPISGDAYSLERKKPTQEFNQQWLDQIMPVYENALKNGLL